MLSSSPLQCLFCNHLNPGGATFCNDCGSQLQLRQCDLCGAINKRSAKICYKCGAPFVALAVHGGHSAIEGGQMGSVLWHEQSDQTTYPESADGDFGKVVANSRQELVQDVVPPIDLARSPAAASAGFRYVYAIACVVLVLTLVFLSIYRYRLPSPAKLAEAGIERTGPDDPAIAGAAPDALSSPSGAAARAHPPAAGSAPAVQNQSARKSCQEAVVALGLCGALAKQEKP